MVTTGAASNIENGSFIANNDLTVIFEELEDDFNNCKSHIIESTNNYSSLCSEFLGINLKNVPKIIDDAPDFSNSAMNPSFPPSVLPSSHKRLRRCISLPVMDIPLHFVDFRPDSSFSDVHLVLDSRISHTRIYRNSALDLISSKSDYSHSYDPWLVAIRSRGFNSPHFHSNLNNVLSDRFETHSCKSMFSHKSFSNFSKDIYGSTSSINPAYASGANPSLITDPGISSIIHSDVQPDLLLEHEQPKKITLRPDTIILKTNLRKKPGYNMEILRRNDRLNKWLSQSFDHVNSPSSKSGSPYMGTEHISESTKSYFTKENPLDSNCSKTNSLRSTLKSLRKNLSYFDTHSIKTSSLFSLTEIQVAPRFVKSNHSDANGNSGSMTESSYLSESASKGITFKANEELNEVNSDTEPSSAKLHRQEEDPGMSSGRHNIPAHSPPSAKSSKTHHFSQLSHFPSFENCLNKEHSDLKVPTFNRADINGSDRSNTTSGLSKMSSLQFPYQRNHSRPEISTSIHQIGSKTTRTLSHSQPMSYTYPKKLSQDSNHEDQNQGRRAHSRSYKYLPASFSPYLSNISSDSKHPPVKSNPKEIKLSCSKISSINERISSMNKIETTDNITIVKIEKKH
ncbi:hypothetical protein AYI68_g696 [Smittium mucronatum]|uniref:Uncharacterized protein n=1 Tax=Smittium mucronatum TaxID=133383 RepID=A0A1R0H7L9_9FUNG|nr:hypothetical protein AYI68_g696 [Smittium mucronatum]